VDKLDGHDVIGNVNEDNRKSCGEGLSHFAEAEPRHACRRRVYEGWVC
jgi:hypothetical protein